MPAVLTQLSNRLQPFDKKALALLVALPVVLYVPWALAGHPLLNGDNLLQNYPLRLLAGELIRHGRLPLWDPDIWSGVPLLAGWNAGAMYPGTWLFAILPGVAAWVLNLVSVGVIAGVGTHLFLRRLGCSPLASLLGALVFTYTGFMSGQALHIGLVEGMAFLPWMLLALDWMARITMGRLSDFALPVALLGVTSGLVVLAGDPRAISNDAIVVLIYWIARVIVVARSRHVAPHGQGPTRIWPLIAGVLGALLIGAALSAVQWFPGLAFLHQSQRAASSATYFNGGSLSFNDLSYLFVPFIYGGNGNFEMPFFAGSYNIAELTYGVGLLPLSALLVLTWRAIRRHASGIWVWVVLFLVGVLLSAGGNTPLGHVLVHLPLYGGERLQNRNAAISDIALAVLLAIFVDTFPGRGEAPVLTPSERQPVALTKAERILGLVPPALAVVLVVAMLAAPLAAEHFVSPTGNKRSTLPYKMSPYYLVVVLIAFAIGALLTRRSFRRMALRTAAALIVAADVVVFIIMSSYQPVPSGVLSATNSATAALATVAANPPGRFAIFNPDQALLGNPYLYLLDRLGYDDLTIVHHMWTVQGYGSAVEAAYEDATGAHEVQNLRPSALLTPTFDELDLQTLVTTATSFGTPEPSPGSVPRPVGPPTPPGTTVYDRQPGNAVFFGIVPPTGPWTIPPSGRCLYLPGSVVTSQAEVWLDPTAGPEPKRLSASLRLRSGRTITATEQVDGRLLVSFKFSASYVASQGGAWRLDLTAPGSHSPLGLPVVSSAAVLVLPGKTTWLSTSGPATAPTWFALDGLIQGLLRPNDWRYATSIGPLTVLHNGAAYGPAWLEAPSATQPDAARVPGSVTEQSVPDWASPGEIVSAPQASLLVRSESYATGWSVTLTPAGIGAPPLPLNLPVRKVGLLQGVEVPPGRYIVTWHYSSRRALAGLGAGAAGAATVLALLLVGGTRRRRNRRRSPPDSLPHALRDLDRDRATVV